jgi:hypothetical protein
VFLARHLAVSGSSVEVGMAKMLLQQPYPVAGIVLFHGMMNGKRIPKPMGAYMMQLARIRINKFGQPGPIRTLPDYLPCPMTTDPEEHVSTAL